jgi:hypothetical protein
MSSDNGKGKIVELKPERQELIPVSLDQKLDQLQNHLERKLAKLYISRYASVKVGHVAAPNGMIPVFLMFNPEKSITEAIMRKIPKFEELPDKLKTAIQSYRKKCEIKIVQSINADEFNKMYSSNDIKVINYRIAFESNLFTMLYNTLVNMSRTDGENYFNQRHKSGADEPD